MFSWNDQHVGWRLGTDVLKGKDVLVLIDLLGRNLAGENAAEQATGGGVGHRLFTKFNFTGGNDTTGASGLSAGLAKLCDQFGEGIGTDVPGAFEGIIQVGQHEVSEEQQQGGDRDRNQAERKIVKRKKEK